MVDLKRCSSIELRDRHEEELKEAPGAGPEDSGKVGGAAA